MGEVSPTGRYLLIADPYRALEDPCEADNAAGGEPDEAAVLIDYRGRTCDTFLFCGTPCSFDWGGWIDSTHFVIAGTESDEETSFHGFVRLYSMSENLVSTWHTPTATLTGLEAYRTASAEHILARCRAWKASRPPS
jgi:hypothetical protein